MRSNQEQQLIVVSSCHQHSGVHNTFPTNPIYANNLVTLVMKKEHAYHTYFINHQIRIMQLSIDVISGILFFKKITYTPKNMLRSLNITRITVYKYSPCVRVNLGMIKISSSCVLRFFLDSNVNLLSSRKSTFGFKYEQRHPKVDLGIYSLWI